MKLSFTTYKTGPKGLKAAHSAPSETPTTSKFSKAQNKVVNWLVHACMLESGHIEGGKMHNIEQ